LRGDNGRSWAAGAIPAGRIGCNGAWDRIGPDKRKSGMWAIPAGSEGLCRGVGRVLTDKYVQIKVHKTKYMQIQTRQNSEIQTNTYRYVQIKHLLKSF
jgi:hypothetical protein